MGDFNIGCMLLFRIIIEFVSSLWLGNNSHEQDKVCVSDMRLQERGKVVKILTGAYGLQRLW